jgi:amino-acid N-acetyltransferase
VVNDEGVIVPELFPNEAQARVEELEAKGDYHSGTVRFLRGAVKACRSGVRRSHLISYQEDGALLQELFSRDGIGTQIVMESAEQIRRATINDIGGILELIRPLEQQGILVRRSREQLEMEIDKFTIIQRDNLTIACAALYPSRKRRSVKWPALPCILTTAAHHAAKCCWSALPCRHARLG